MFSCYSDAFCSKTPLGITLTKSQLYLTTYLPSPLDAKTGKKTDPAKCSLTISCNCHIRLGPLLSTGKSFLEAGPPF